MSARPAARAKCSRSCQASTSTSVSTTACAGMTVTNRSTSRVTTAGSWAAVLDRRISARAAGQGRFPTRGPCVPGTKVRTTKAAIDLGKPYRVRLGAAVLHRARHAARRPTTTRPHRSALIPASTRRTEQRAITRDTTPEPAPEPAICVEQQPHRCADMCALCRGPDRNSGATFCAAAMSADRQFRRVGNWVQTSTTRTLGDHNPLRGVRTIQVPVMPMSGRHGGPDADRVAGATSAG
jgi:hypothetical protein